jgi:phosphohistidine phosphatase
MKTLFLLRHAKSSWHDPDLPDFERPLNDRGLRTAPFMGEFMKANGLSPAIILSSPAVRARTTAELVKKAGDIDAEIQFDKDIYEASPQQLYRIISEISDANESAMIVGHNPGMEGIVQFLTGRLEAMPTAALAVIDLDVSSWSEVTHGCGELQAIHRPKEIQRGDA